MALTILKGLTSADRAAWDSTYKSYLDAHPELSEEDKDRLYKDTKFKERFGNREDYSSLKLLSPEERDALYNEEYDRRAKMLDSIGTNLSDTVGGKSQSQLDAIHDYREQAEKQVKAAEDAEEAKARSEAYKDVMQKYDDLYGKSAYDKYKGIKGIKQQAEEVSSYYKKYKDTDYLPWTDKDWAEVAKEYQAQLEVNGQESADLALNIKIQDTVSKNQGIGEKIWHGFTGMGASAAGALVATAGMIKGAIDYIDGDYEDVEGLNGFQNIINAMMDNTWTRYGDDIIETGSLFKSGMDEVRSYSTKYNSHGLSNLDIVQTYQDMNGDLVDQIFNVNTIPVAAQSGGFTVASMLTGAGEAKLVQKCFQWAGKGIKALTLAEAGMNTTSQLRKAITALEYLRKAEKATNAFLIPASVGTVEGIIEGLGTKKQVLEDGQRQIADMQSQFVDRRFKELYDTEYDKRFSDALKNYSSNIESGESSENIDPKEVSQQVINELYQQAWDEYSDKYEASVAQLEYAASKAGVNNFLVNSAINGIINATLKAGIHAEPVQGALRNNRFTSWAFKDGKLKVSGTGENVSVTGKLPWYNKAWNISKELGGEFTEEYLQSISDATMRGGAENNIHEFISRKYNGDTQVKVGDTFGTELAAAWNALGESLLDTESIKSGIYGALSSAMGTPAMRLRDYTRQVKNADGSYSNVIDFSKRDKESILGYMGRMIPWRSGFADAIRENIATEQRLQEEASALQEWLRDPANKARFDGVTGTLAWAEAMQNASIKGDEFGYRNSALGKSVNDAFMLQKLRGTEFYDQWMNQLETIANMEEGSEEAQKFVGQIMNNVNTQNNFATEQEAFEAMKKNANYMLQTLANIEEESDRIESIIGNMDEDTKQAMVYAQLQLEDWKSRAPKLNDEINEAAKSIGEPTVPASEITDEQKDIISRYGSIHNAKARREELLKQEESIEAQFDNKEEQRVANLKDDIDNLERRKNRLSKNEKKILAEKKKKVVELQKKITYNKKAKRAIIGTINRELKTLEGLDEMDESKTILNEEEIMALNPVDRARMLNKANRKAYSDEQLAVIDNIIERGTQADRNFYNKVQDAGRMEIGTKQILKEYQAVLEDTRSLSAYANRARLAAQDVISKKRFDALTYIENYTDFANELDKILQTSSRREQDLIWRNLKNQGRPFFERYSKEKQEILDLVDTAAASEEFGLMDVNDQNMYIHTLHYLTNNGIDLNNPQEVVATLSRINEQGRSAFETYVDEVNAGLPDYQKTTFTSIGEAIQTFNDVMDAYTRDKQERESNASPINIEVTTPEQNNPAPVDKVEEKPTSAVGIFASAATDINTPDAGQREEYEEQKKQANPQEEPQEKPQAQGQQPGYTGIFGQASTTLEGQWTDAQKSANQDGIVEDDTAAPTDTPKTPPSPAAPTAPDSPSAGQSDQSFAAIINNYKTNSNERVAQAATVALNVITNTAENRADNTVKSYAVNTISELSDNEFETVEEFADALTRTANQLIIESDDQATQSLANVLTNAAVRAKTIGNSNGNTSASSGPTLFGLVRNQANRLPTVGSPARRNNSNPNAARMQTLDIEGIESVQGNTGSLKHLVDYYNAHSIGQFLRSGYMEEHRPRIYFITDPSLNENIPAQYERSLIPVVEVDPSEIGTQFGNIIIDNKHYQPLGIMPSSTVSSNNSNPVSGYARTAPIRAAIKNSAPGELIVDEDGVTISSTMVGGIEGAPPQQIPKNQPNRSARDLALQDFLTADEYKTLMAIPPKNRRNHPLYQKAKDEFMKHFRKGTEVDTVTLEEKVDGSPALVFEVQTGKLGAKGQKGKTISIQEFQLDYQTLEDRNSYTLVSELFAADQIDAALDSNSRIAWASRILDNVFKNSKLGDVMVEEENGVYVPASKEDLEIITATENKLNHDFREALKIPVGWTFKLTPSTETIGTEDNTKRLFELTLEKQGMDAIPLGKVTQGEMSTQTQFNILKNLMLDGAGNLRTERVGNRTYSFLKPNINYSDVGSSDAQAKNRVSEVFDDGTLAFSKTSLKYSVNGISINAPFSDESRGTQPLYPKTIASNDNATNPPITSSPSGTAAPSAGTNVVVDPSTGAIVSGTPASPARREFTNGEDPTINTVLEEAKERVIKTQNVVQPVAERDPHANHYLINGEKYTRVHGAIGDVWVGIRSATAEANSARSLENGSLVDGIVRDFFNGVTPVRPETFTEEAFNSLIESLTKIKEEMVRNNEIFLTNNIVLYHEFPNGVKLAGEADIISIKVVNGKPQYNIYDLKTSAGGRDGKAFEKSPYWETSHGLGRRNSIVGTKEQYTTQVSLYKLLLDNMLGINTANLGLLPYQLSYDSRNNVIDIQKHSEISINYDKDVEKLVAYYPAIEHALKQIQEQYEGIFDDKQLEVLKSIISNYIVKNVDYTKDLEAFIRNQGKEAKFKNIGYDSLNNIINELKETISSIDVDNILKDNSSSGPQNVEQSNENNEEEKDKIDVTTGLKVGEVKDRRRKRGTKPGAKAIDPNKRTTPIMDKLKWNKWDVTDEKLGTLDVEETKKNLEKAGITEEVWNDMTDEEMLHELKCKGVYKKTL